MASRSNPSNKAIKLWIYGVGAVAWVLAAMFFPVPGIVVNVLVIAALIGLMVSGDVRDKVWRAAGRTPPARVPLLPLLGLTAISAVSLVLAISWVGEAERREQAKAEQQAAAAKAQAAEQAARQQRLQELLAAARQLGGHNATIDNAIGKYIDAEKLGSLPSDDVTRLAGLLKSKGDTLVAAGDLEGAISAYQQAQARAPKLDGLAVIIQSTTGTLHQRQATEARKAAVDKYDQGIRCARVKLKEAKGDLKKPGGYRLVQVSVNAAADCLTEGTQAVIAAIEKWGAHPQLDKIAKGRATKQLTAQLGQVKERAARMEEKAAAQEARRDAAHLKQILSTIARKAGYVARVETGERGHNELNVYVNQAWHYKPQTVKEEQIRIIEQLLIPHLQAFHPGATPQVNIYDLSGKRIGKTGLFGVSAD